MKSCFSSQISPWEEREAVHRHGHHRGGGLFRRGVEEDSGKEGSELLKALLRKGDHVSGWRPWGRVSRGQELQKAKSGWRTHQGRQGSVLAPGLEALDD